MKSVSFILSMIATVLGIIEPYNKRMKTILIFNFIGNLLVGTSYLIDAAYSGAAICGVACVQVFINYNFDARKKKVPKWLLGVYALLFSAVNMISFAHWYDILSLLAALMAVLYAAQSDAKYYRIFYMTNSLLWIGYDFVTEAHANLATHIILFVSTVISIIIRDRKKNKQ